MTYSKEYIDRAEEVILHTYNRFQIVLDKGNGVHLYDVDGKEYLDFAAGIAVFALGYNNQAYNQALKDQIDKVIHTSNLYYNVPMMEAAEKLVKATGLSKVFFTNSGTEAIEGAIKVARKYAYLKDGSNDHEIIAMNHSFHGRSLGALSVTGNTHYQDPFKPLIGGIKFADFNDLESVKAQITDKTCAIIMETVQGEGGIYPAEPEFLQGVRKLCDEHDILLILDEIQCGMGRTGSMFACQAYGVQPDVMTCAKALGCGVPVGAFVLNEKTANASLVPGDHGTTYGGNPLACAAVSKVFDLFESEKIVEHVNKVAPYLEEKLDQLVEKYDFITTRRGKGLMQGLVLEGKPVGEVTGTSDKLPVEEQLKMIREMLPDAKKIGIMYTTSEANSVSAIKEYKSLVKKYDFELVEKGITTTADVSLATDDLLSKVDCITNLTDNTVVASLPTILDKANEKKIPVFGSEIEQVKIGCLAAEGIDYIALGKQTGKMAAKVLKGEAKASEQNFETITEPGFYVNNKVAEDLGITVPEDIANSAVESFGDGN